MIRVLWVKAAAVAIAGALVGGVVTTVLTADAEATLGPVATAWVDEPLHASSHPMGPIEVTVHATDVDTVAALEVSIDGEMVADIAVADPDTLVWETFEWTPAAPGQYQLEAVGRDPKGDRGEVGIATFTVGDAGGDPADPNEVAAPADTTTTSPASSTTETTTSSSTTTTTTTTTTIAPASSISTSTSSTASTTTTPPPTTSCSPATPTVTDASTESIDSSGATVRITWTYTGCSPNGFSVVVSSAGNAPVTQNVGAAARSATFTLPTCTDYTVQVQALGNDKSPSSDPYEFATDCG